MTFSHHYKPCTSSAGWLIDIYEEGRYFFKGANPNNYITFNNETWRILSVESDGSLKIVRDELLPRRSWDSSSFVNDWDGPADIKTYLNGEYLDSIMANKDKIKSNTWSVGAAGIGDNLSMDIVVENNKRSQEASVGLITVSEYIRANSNIEECGNSSLNNSNSITCPATNWLYNNSDAYWTISPELSAPRYVFIVRNDGTCIRDFVHFYYSVLPSLYLTSDLKLQGEGTEQDPYIITN